MSARKLYAVLVLCLAMCVAAIGQQRWVTGEYRNEALGFAVRIPRGLRGLAGDEAGPERGVQISLGSSTLVAVYGEPNSLEYKTPAEGVRDSLSNHNCHSDQPEISPARVGSLHGAKGRVVCGEQVTEEMLVFRPGGGPIYWLRLETTTAHEKDDEATLSKVAAGFRLIRWR